MGTLHSMTGFGQAEMKASSFLVKAEARSVNNRHARIIIKAPELLSSYDIKLEQLVRHKVARGTITISLLYEDLTGNTGYVLDGTVMRRYKEHLATLQKELNCPGEISIETLASLPGSVHKQATPNSLPEKLWETIRTVVEEALDSMIGMRAEEGAYLAKEMKSILALISELLNKVEQRVPGMLDEYKTRLHNRLQSILDETESEFLQQSVHREIALFADRSDITEEISRMHSHLSQCEDAVANSGPIGRKLEFIAQEMFREANTMASKANDAQMVRDIVSIKGEVEKFKEQALNVE